MLEVIGIISSVMAIAGVVLNNRMRIECFYLWWVSNAIFVGIHVHAGIWSLAGRDVVFLVLAVHGWHCWKKNRECTRIDANLPRAETPDEIESRIRFGCTYPSCGDCQECFED